jgi:hypothetical protein
VINCELNSVANLPVLMGKTKPDNFVINNYAVSAGPSEETKIESQCAKAVVAVGDGSSASFGIGGSIGGDSLFH